MTIAPRRQPSRTKRNRTSLLFERGMALLASANLVLVLFDLSYIPLRNFWLQGRVQFYARIAKYEWKFPAEPVRILPVNVTHAYDWVKGIEENRDTAYYLQRVEDLQAKIQQINDLTLRLQVQIMALSVLAIAKTSPPNSAATTKNKKPSLLNSGN